MAAIAPLPALPSPYQSSWPGSSSQGGLTRLATRNSAELGQVRVPMPSTPSSETGALFASGVKPEVAAKARANAVDFESMFLNSMFSQMFTGIDGEGPFGGGGAGGVWRSFLTEQYAKTFAKAGGIGIADHVYRALMAQQEARAQ